MCFFISIFFLLLILGYGGPKILLDGATTDRSLFCPRDNLTVVCFGSSEAYRFIVGTIITGTDLFVSSAFQTNMALGFTARYISMNESRLEFVVPNNFENNTLISCIDPINGNLFANLSLALYGKIYNIRILLINMYTQLKWSA